MKIDLQRAHCDAVSGAPERDPAGPQKEEHRLRSKAQGQKQLQAMQTHAEELRLRTQWEGFPAQHPIPNQRASKKGTFTHENVIHQAAFLKKLQED